MVFRSKRHLCLNCLGLLLCISSFAASILHAEPSVPIIIGVAGNFSGGSDSTNNQWNKYIYPAVELAVLRFQNKDPMLSRRIKIVKLDYAGRKDLVLDAVNQAVNLGVLAVVGFDQSEYAEIAASRFEQLGISLITHSATADRITKDRSYIFRACFTNSAAASYFARFVREKLFVKTIIALPESTCLYCSDLNERFSDAFTALGGNIFVVKSDVRGGYDWDKVKMLYENQLPNSHVAFFVPNHEGNSGKAVRQLLASFKDPLILGGDGWGDTGQLFFKIVGQQSFFGYKWAHWAIDQNGTVLQRQFIDGFRQKTGVNPVESAALMHDAISILLDAIKSAPRITRPDIRNALANVDNYNGITGRISLDEKTPVGKSPLFQYVVQGSFRAVIKDNIR